MVYLGRDNHRDFAEAERKALEEAERIKRFEYDRKRKKEGEKARKEAEAARLKVQVNELGYKKTNTTITDTLWHCHI